MSNKFKVVIVHWVDACYNERKHLSQEPGLLGIIDIGFIFKEDKDEDGFEYIRLCQTLAPEYNSCFVDIPRGCIKKIEEIGEIEV